MNALVALLMGLAYVAPPGPVNVETIRRGSATGFRGAFGLQLGALVGDLFYAALALLGVGALLPPTALRLGLAPLGAIVLVYLGYTALRDGVYGLRAVGACGSVIGGDASASMRRGVLAGIGISLANPFAVAFWLTVSGAVLPHMRGNVTTFLAAFFAGVLAWAVALPVLTWSCRAALHGRGFHCVSVACGAALVAFGVGVGSAVIFPGGTIAHALF